MHHFLGIGGVGMAGVAVLLKARGFEVAGCDLYATARTRWLESQGIPVAVGHSPDHLKGLGPDDTLVVTPAVPQDAPELLAAREKGLKIVRRGEMLARIVNETPGSVAVCGTHGKTTTTLFATRLLQALGESPAWCIGSETGEMPVASAGGRLLVEADESDGTLALYRPDVLVLNAVDFDHLEHFDSPEAYFECYRTAIRNTRRCVIVCKDHPKALELAHEAARCPVVTFGLSDDADVRLADWPELTDALGQNAAAHNFRNALAAIAVARTCVATASSPSHVLKAAFSRLPDRRFELVVSSGGVEVFTDYAHHPAEIACAMDMARRRVASHGAATFLSPAGGKNAAAPRLLVVFEPHRYSRTKALLNEFPSALSGADELILAPVYPAFEAPVPGGDIADLYRAFRNACPNETVLLARSLDEAWRHVSLTARRGDVILLLGAGTIGTLAERAKAEMPERGLPARDTAGWQPAPRQCPRPREPQDLSRLSFFRTGGKSYGGGARVPVGMGSNLWISDCATDAEYVRPAGNASIPGARFIEGRPHLNFMRGIPGTLGGWVKMNAGAFGHSIGEFVEAVRLADGRRLTATECRFGYRKSAIDGMVEEVAFREGDFPATPVPQRKTFPPRCCGSVFKNPPGDFAGRLLEAAGAKNLAVGGARVWQEHANVIVAEAASPSHPAATSSDILALARLMALAVFHQTGIRLECEIAGLEVFTPHP